MGNRRKRSCKYCGSTPRRGQGICRKCEARPKAENIRRLKTHLAFETLFGFLLQSNISAGNIKTMTSMRDIDDEAFRSVLDLVQEIARLHPRKRRRWKWLRKNQPELYDRIRHNETFDWLRDLNDNVDYEEDYWQVDDMNYVNSLLTEEYFREQNGFDD